MKSIGYFIIVIGFMCSCRREVYELTQAKPSSFSQIFDQFWNKMNTNYVYWDVDKTDWFEVYKTYKPLFSHLDINNQEDIRRSVQYFRGMTDKLIDNHYFISFTQSVIADSTVYPAFSRKKSSASFHYPYSYIRADTPYLDPSFIINIDNNYSVNGVPLIALSGVIRHDILYFSCNHFSLYKSYQSNSTKSIRPAVDNFFYQYINSKYRGIIIDVRSNQGGDNSDLNFFLGRFINQPLAFGYTQSKIGNTPRDFSSWIKAVVNPYPDGKRISVPIVVLADNVTASLAEAMVMAIKALPKSTFLGEMTWGATGPVTSEQVFNAGSFQISGFMNVQTSSCKFKYLDGIIYEDIGFNPDILIPSNLNELSNGIDLQLERAINQF